MAEWKADVPFPAENMTRCRGCGTPIGFVRHEDEETGQEKAHPVEVLGWEGVESGAMAPKCRRGFTADGRRTAVVEARRDGLFDNTKGRIAVFESHFPKCPERAQFYGGRK